MADPRGFLKHTERDLPTRRPVELRLLDYNEVYNEFDGQRLRTQASRCMDCGIPFCHNGCPLGNLIPEWNDLVYRNDWAAGIERLHATNNFPEFTGRLCPAPCEASCVLGINQPPVTIKQVELELVEKAFADDTVVPVMPSRRTGRSVAVVGSGPAGLAAAQQLTRAGHAVTVFERADRIGGLLRYGIPEFKIEKHIIDRRLAQMEAEGTVLRTGVNVGVDVTAEQLRSRFDAVVLATGSTIGRDLPIPGRDLDGIHQAMEYLPQANRAAVGDDDRADVSSPGRCGRPQITARGKKVVIIGGGDTGADCLGTALRQGAQQVHQFEIMPRPPAERAASTPWPLYPLMYRVSSAHEEGGERVFSVNTEQFVGRNGAVTGLKAHEVTMTAGRFEKVEGSDFELECDLVLLAMGFLGPERAGLLDELGVAYDARGTIARDEHFAADGLPGVFVAGDAGRGQSLIVWAIAEGRSVAAAVDVYLTESTELPAPIVPTQVAQR
ncbi:glutamate synthase small subunit [Gordonia hirsuta DSM 44140 = NBRC 16056]|uniref:Glutamate synthase small subunit n=1 Tax=Gordonia hirsuta DSM 44140 = NBRC 16056 TaxID=1121927 RepID=L7LCB4_9ACTN|nr:glutamate synthase subunit beta [Gordonia hirsuta]GAC57678.1 glutamate synthase small subunit [Gordonia hirsuta DSM 44140 = NBRC 16056]